MTTSTVKVIRSIDCHKKYGVSISTAHYISRNYFSPPESYKDIFDKFFLLYWRGAHLASQVQNGTVQKDGVIYNIIYRKPCLKIFSESQIRLSFRQAKPEFELPAYVIVDTL